MPLRDIVARELAAAAGGGRRRRTHQPAMRGTGAGRVSTRARASVLRPAADRAVNLLGVGLKLLLARLEVSRSSAPSCPPSPAPPGCPMPDSRPTTLPAASPRAPS